MNFRVKSHFTEQSSDELLGDKSDESVVQESREIGTYAETTKLYKSVTTEPNFDAITNVSPSLANRGLQGQRFVRFENARKPAHSPTESIPPAVANELPRSPTLPVEYEVPV